MVSTQGDPAAEEWSQWSTCSLTCGQGWQVRTRSCVSSPYGTLCSGALRETRMCNNTAACPGGDPGILSSASPAAICLEGQWLEWSPWSQCSVTCSAGTEQRQRRCSSAAHSWAECQGEHQERRGCSKPSCSGGGNWGSWNHWSLCSKSCDSGWQRRSRMCDGPGLQGPPCQGSGEEDRTCNHKKCPAGETVYNKCPTNGTGSASRRCMLDTNGVAFWGPPSFARCISLEYRYLHVSLREHLAKGKRTLAGEGMSQIVRSLLELLQRRSFHSGDLLFSTHILRNVTDTFKRATYIPAPDDVQRFFQVKPFQSVLVVTNNLMITIQREPVSAVSSDINFPLKGRRGMKDWARTAEDKLYIPKEVFTAPAKAILYRTLGSILPAPKPPALINSKILAVTVRPEPQPSEPMVVVELSPLLNGAWQRSLEPDASECKGWLRWWWLSSAHRIGFVTSGVWDNESGVWDNESGVWDNESGVWDNESGVWDNESGVWDNESGVWDNESGVWDNESGVWDNERGVWDNDRAGGTSDPQCVVWDYGNPEAGAESWGTEGCQTLSSTALHQTRCLCSRISTYALLAQRAKDPKKDMGPSSMPSVPLMVGCGVSCSALIILYIRSERSIILVNFCLSILASNMLILVGQSQTLSKGLCTVTAAFLHFFFLSSFCWVLTEAWQSYLSVIGKMRSRLIRKRFLCLGWVATLAKVAGKDKAGWGKLGLGRGELGLGRGELGLGQGELGLGRGELGLGRGELGLGRGELGLGRGELGLGRGELGLGGTDWG
ncbi:hypothetical protein NHX12_024030 [Muraenolepis orangiensis]|uniref:G-protein coupled receptors family 2 profile 2 domain-containing protein n=1 Tax=Muraenolepis orangiensis TaxID=630683 RepID=A0A9Q0ELY7_9TELE|nr:hypothetical protein NHX12_024030 [Muraenolepis orangiensis]